MNVMSPSEHCRQVVLARAQGMVSGGSMPSSYAQIEQLLQRRRVSGLHGTLLFEQRSEIAMTMVEASIAQACPGWRKAPGPIPQWLGRSRQVTWQHPAISLTANLAESDPGIEPEAALKQGKAQLLRLLRQLEGLGSVRLAGLIVDVDFSSAELPAVGPLIAAFLNPSLGPIADAEWRAGVKDGRYFINTGLSSYETRKFQFSMTIGASAPFGVQSQIGDLIDQGLRLRVDVNTKVNISEGGPPIVVVDQDLEQLVSKGVQGVNRALQLLRDGP